MNDMSHSDLSHYVSDCTVLGKLEPNCAGMMFVRSFKKIIIY